MAGSTGKCVLFKVVIWLCENVEPYTSVNHRKEKMCESLCHCCIFRSTRPNNIRGGNVRPSVSTSVRPSVRPFTKSLSDFNEIWCLHKGRWVMHEGMPYDPIQSQGQGHGVFEVPKIALFKVLSPPPFTEGAGKWPLILKLEHNI